MLAAFTPCWKGQCNRHTSQALWESPAAAKTSGMALNHGPGRQPPWILVRRRWVSPAVNPPRCSALITWGYRQRGGKKNIR